jgi:uncharacterized protein (TIGR02996 family)
MSERDAFLAGILAHPEDDAPRLLYADWLDERADPRGEFIRVQVSLANPDYRECIGHVHSVLCGDLNAPRVARHQKHDALRRRERELFESMGANPFAFGAGLCTVTIDRDKWERPGGVFPGGLIRRGFVEALTLTAAAWLTYADAITAAAPIQEVTLTTWPEVRSVPYGLSRLVSDESPRFHEHSLIFPNMMGRLVRMIRIEGPLDTGRATRELLAAEWPRIKFTLPPSNLLENSGFETSIGEAPDSWRTVLEANDA